jgi:DNA-binding response OmpR family regulator
VDVYVGYLRTKLERLGTTKVSVESVRGVGYRLLVDEV